MSALEYFLVMVAALGILALLKRNGRPVDHDPGPLPGQRYPLWDKWSPYHLIGSAILGFVSCMLGVEPLWALAITLLGGVGWEVIHGHVDRGDLLFDLIGTVAGIALCLVLT
jgi:hypothetical protein